MKGFIRPPMKELPADALVDRTPPEPSHEVVRRQPWYPDDDEARAEPSGYLESGARVALVTPDERFSRVVDERGRTVQTESAGLRPITRPRSPRRVKSTGRSG